jgi:hypothetical protein
MLENLLGVELVQGAKRNIGTKGVVAVELLLCVSAPRSDWKLVPFYLIFGFSGLRLWKWGRDFLIYSFAEGSLSLGMN